jgi:hypothetical protein
MFKIYIGRFDLQNASKNPSCATRCQLVPPWNLAVNARELLRLSFPKAIKKIKNVHIIQRFFKQITPRNKIYLSTNGFVDTAVRGLQQASTLRDLSRKRVDCHSPLYQHLLQNPAEEFRDTVTHEGQKNPEINSSGSGGLDGDAMRGVDKT